MDLTVVIPAYNASGTIGAAVASAKACEAHVIVVDDGSEDDSGAVARRLGAQVVRQENAGAAAARRFGFEICATPYVLFLDADDVLSPSGVDASLILARGAERTRIVGGAVVGESSSGRTQAFRPWIGGVDLIELLRRGYSPVPPGSFIWPASLLREVEAMEPPPLSPPYAEDYELLVRGSMLAEIVLHGEPCLRYSLDGGKSTVVPSRSLQCSEDIRRYYARYCQIPITFHGRRHIFARAQVRVAQSLRANGSRFSAFQRLFVATLLDPRMMLGLARSFAASRSNLTWFARG